MRRWWGRVAAALLVIAGGSNVGPIAQADQLGPWHTVSSLTCASTALARGAQTQCRIDVTVSSPPVGPAAADLVGGDLSVKDDAAGDVLVYDSPNADGSGCTTVTSPSELSCLFTLTIGATSQLGGHHLSFRFDGTPLSGVLGSTANLTEVAVIASPDQLSLTCTPAVAAGQPVICGATVAGGLPGIAATGTVTFEQLVGKTSYLKLGSCTLGHSGGCGTKVGVTIGDTPVLPRDYLLTAHYDGDLDYPLADASATVVVRADVTTTGLSCDAATPSSGQPIHCQMVVTDPDNGPTTSVNGSFIAVSGPDDTVSQPGDEGDCAVEQQGATSVCRATVTLGAAPGLHTVVAVLNESEQQSLLGSTASVVFRLAPTSMAVSCEAAAATAAGVVGCTATASAAGAPLDGATFGFATSDPADSVSFATPGDTCPLTVDGPDLVCSFALHVSSVAGVHTVTSTLLPGPGAGQASSAATAAVNVSVQVQHQPPSAQVAVTCPDPVPYGGSGLCTANVAVAGQPAAGTVAFDPNHVFPGTFTPATCDLAAGGCTVSVALDASTAAPASIGFSAVYADAAGDSTVTAGAVKARLPNSTTSVRCRATAAVVGTPVICVATTTVENGAKPAHAAYSIRVNGTVACDTRTKVVHACPAAVAGDQESAGFTIDPAAAGNTLLVVAYSADGVTPSVASARLAVRARPAHALVLSTAASALRAGVVSIDLAVIDTGTHGRLTPEQGKAAAADCRVVIEIRKLGKECASYDAAHETFRSTVRARHVRAGDYGVVVVLDNADGAVLARVTGSVRVGPRG